MTSLSIVIPAYNAEKHLDACLSSVVNAMRTLSGDSQLRCEALVVDDASDDSTATLLAAWTQAHEQIRAFRHTANGGAAAARNTAIAQSASDWVLYLDADNVLYP
ncbi:MAG: glycosyltransferase family 2 protein, partial [Thiomonas sp.]